MFSDQKLFFRVCDDPTEITLAEALVGRGGVVNLGTKGIALWTPNALIEDLQQEIICDLRWEAISDAAYRRFIEAAEGRFLGAHLVLFKGKHPEKIKHALKFFDYVLVPDKRIKNLPKDFRKRVLSYEGVTQDREI